MLVMNNVGSAQELNGWTKVGDKYSSRGKWTIYKHGGTFGSLARIVRDFVASKESEAHKAYSGLIGTVKRGGLWLVAPDGTVTKSLYKNYSKL